MMGILYPSAVIARRPAQPGNEANHHSRNSIAKADGFPRRLPLLAMTPKMEAA